MTSEMYVSADGAELCVQTFGRSADPTVLVADAVAIRDALDVDRAHIVGRSMSGVIALALGVEHPSRVRSLTFVSTTTGGADLPPMSPAFPSAAGAVPDTSDEAATVDYVVELMRAYPGGIDGFDDAP